MNNASRKMFVIIGKAILNAREDKGWSQGKLADKAKIEQSTMHRYERGIKVGRNARQHTDMPMSRYIQLCKILNIDAGELFMKATGR